MRTTEKESRYDHLDTMDTGEILRGINTEDHTVPVAVGEAIPQIAQVVEQLVERVRQGGRIFYLGAGTSGRLGEALQGLRRHRRSGCQLELVPREQGLLLDAV